MNKAHFKILDYITNELKHSDFLVLPKEVLEKKTINKFSISDKNAEKAINFLSKEKMIDVKKAGEYSIHDGPIEDINKLKIKSKDEYICILNYEGIIKDSKGGYVREAKINRNNLCLNRFFWIVAPIAASFAAVFTGIGFYNDYCKPSKNNINESIQLQLVETEKQLQKCEDWIEVLESNSK